MKVDYVVIYGCHIKRLLDKRLEHALRYLNKNMVDKIVLTGGVGILGKFNESQYMYEYLLKNGIPKEKMLLEDQSRTTWENNLNIMHMLQLDKVDKPLSIVLITQKFHLLRVLIHWKKVLHNDYVRFYNGY